MATPVGAGPPQLVVRPAGEADALPIATVHVATWRAAYRGIVADAYIDALTVDERAAAWAERLSARAPATPAGVPAVFVATVGEEVVGFASGGGIGEPQAGYDAELYALYVLPVAQGNGVGRRLVVALAAALARRGHRALVVNVLAANPARRFYERLGARLLGTHQRPIGGVPYAEARYGWAELRVLAGGRSPR